MRSVFVTTLVAASLAAGSALAQETSLGWYEDNWEATTFPTSQGMDCSVDSRADNFPDSAGAWVFVFPSYLQFAPNSGLPLNGVGQVSVDNGATIPMQIYDGQLGVVADQDDLPLLQAIAQGSVMTIEVWPANAPNSAVEYIYSLSGFREAYLRIAAECRFDPSPVLDSPIAIVPVPGVVSPDTGDGEPSTEGSSLFSRDRQQQK